MFKNKGVPSFFCLVMMVFLQSNGCTSCSGVPSDFNKVVLHATATKIGVGQTVTITASVPRDTTGAGVTWLFTANMGAPTPPGVFTPTSVTSATYAAPTTAVAAQFTVTIQATSIAFPTEVNSVTITIEQTQPLTITTTTLPNGVVGTPYPAGTQLQASGGVPPYTWQLTSAASTFPTGLALNSVGTITGTPSGSPGVFNTFTVMVSDSEPTPMTDSTTAGQLSITITNALNGNYAFEFSGFSSTGVAFVAAGSFSADGVSKISNGVEDVNTVAAGTYANKTFTGTFTLTNNRGQLVLPGVTYDFAIDSTGLHGRLIQSDVGGTTGTGSGELVQQNTAICGSQTMSGAGPLGADFVIGLTGAEGNFTGTTPGPFALAGRFTAEVPASSSTPGTIDTGEDDSNSPGLVTTQDTTFSGTFQTSAQAARCVMSVTQALGAMNFSVYPITTTSGLLTEAFIVETDQVSQTTPFVSVGKLIHQTGYPFTDAFQSFPSSPASVGGISGPVIPTGGNAYVPFAAVAQLQGSGGTSFTLSLAQNVGGTFGTALGASAIPASFNTDDTFGRVDTTLGAVNGQIAPVFYVINNNEALCVLANLNSPALGIFEPQSMGTAQTFSASTVPGTLIQGTSMPSASTVQNFSGFIALTSVTATNGTIAATEDTPTALAITTPNVAGTYALTASGPTDGSGSLILTQASPPPPFNGAFFIVSPTKIVMITTSDTNPVLGIFGEQTDDFGVN
jgi:hypothetical protein